jgi:hypothetical protein
LVYLLNEDFAMPKPGGTEQHAGKPRGGRARASAVVREAKKSFAGRDTPMPQPRVHAIMSAAGESGLLRDKTGRISGRVSPTLVQAAKARTGIRTDTDLIEFALANLAIEDRFAEAFKAARGTIDPDLDIGF